MAPPLMANAGRKFPAGVIGKTGKKGRNDNCTFSTFFTFLFISVVGFGLIAYRLLIMVDSSSSSAFSRSFLFGKGQNRGLLEEEEEDELHGCPVCVKPEIARPPLDRPLNQWGSKIRLCTGSEISPFISGTLSSKMDLDEENTGLGLEMGEDSERSYAQLTVFEAEVRHIATLASSDQLVTSAASNLQGGGEGKAGGKKHVTVLRFLAFLEDDASIKRTQWEGWGAAEPSKSYKGNAINLKCLIWPGHDRSIQHLPPAYSVDAIIERRYSFHIVFTCTLPPYPFKNKDSGKGTKKEGRAYFVQFGQHFQVQLVNKNEDEELRMSPLLLCRSEHEPSLLHLQPSHVAPAVPMSSLSKGNSGEGKDVGLFGEEGGKGKGGGKGMQVGVCLRPFHTKQLFSNDLAFSDLRLIEWVEATLMMGVDRIYFYDRYGTEKKALLHPYIERGQVIHIPFPPWSEVFFRKELYAKKARVPYLFPEIYDQIISYEHCMMQGRRFGDRWQFHIDADEFLWYSPHKGAWLKPLLAKIEANHTRIYKAPLRVMKLRRFNFFGVEKENRGDPVLHRLQWRCSQPMWHTEGWAGWHDKLAVNPQLIVPNTVTIHNTDVPETNFVVSQKEMFHINHYTSTGIDLGHHPCRPWVKPLKDEGLLWVNLKVWKCKRLQCSRRIPIECWPFCILPWPEAHLDHKGDPESEIDLSAEIGEDGENYPGISVNGSSLVSNNGTVVANEVGKGEGKEVGKEVGKEEIVPEVEQEKV